MNARNNKRIILASASPRRSELLSMVGITFETVCSDVDESIDVRLSPNHMVEELAVRKAWAVVDSINDSHATVIAADTIVVLDGKIFGKPCTTSEAAEMLSLLSGRTHRVFTGVCIIRPDEPDEVFCEETDVTFHDLNPNEIAAYIATGEPMDKAGGYGIQGPGAVLIRKIDGDFYNVMGLPISRVWRALKTSLEK